MKKSDAFPTNYLKEPDLNGQRVNLTITHVTTEDLGGDIKRAVHFKGTDKILILNVTNWNMISEIAGKDDDDEWTGTRICLYPTKTDFKGERKPCIRVDYPKGNGNAAPAPAQAATAKAKPALVKPEPVEMPTADEVFGNGGDLDSDVPF